jgi:hypothetical protein
METYGIDVLTPSLVICISEHHHHIHVIRYSDLSAVQNPDMKGSEKGRDSKERGRDSKERGSERGRDSKERGSEKEEKTFKNRSSLEKSSSSSYLSQSQVRHTIMSIIWIS